MNPRRSLFVSLSALAAFLMTSPCVAEEGEFQLGVGTPFFIYADVTTEEELLGVESEITSSGIAWGIGHGVFAELGYGVTDNIVVGGFFELSGTSSEDEDEDGDDIDSSTLNFFLAPKFDWVFLPGDKVQPFVGGALGYVHSSAEVENIEQSLGGFQFMGRFGIRIFPGKEFSIDPALVFNYASVSGEREVGPATTDLSRSGYQLGIVLGFSGWIG